MVSIRGAITVKNNTKEDILNATTKLLDSILSANNIKINNINNIIFTVTKDLDQAYPAVAARNLNINEAALMCVQEMYVENSLKKCIRLMMQCDLDKSQSEVQHIYLEEAKILRPDLV